MPTGKQKPISINNRRRAALNRHKEQYDKSVGKRTDWGTFLSTVTLLGLASAGVYHLVKAKDRSPESVEVACYDCSEVFLMAVPQGTGRAVYTSCPHCGFDMVVDLGTTY